ncbi:MAG: hypothetical protein EOO45_06735 [Flavobacterium sp.]|nr:MAG: hypothetical protein EOO45_06735 [Flavobacterium sp.]
MPVPRKKSTRREPSAAKTTARKPRTAAPRTTKPRHTRGPWLLLVVDNEPIRREAVAEYQKLEEEINVAQELIEAFEGGDLPAYQRWESSLFGPLLTELRTTLQTIEEKRAILMEVEEEMFSFLRRSFRVGAHALKPEFQKLLNKLKEYEGNPLETRAFAYLDVISWLESKIHNVNVQDVIRGRYRERTKGE